MMHLIGIVAYVTAAFALVVLSGIVLGNDATAAIIAALLVAVCVALLAFMPRRERIGRPRARYSRTDDEIWNDPIWDALPEQPGEWTAIEAGERALVVSEP